MPLEVIGSPLGWGSSPVSWGDGRLDVFGAGPNGALQQWWWDGSAWQFFQFDGGRAVMPAGSTPSAVSRRRDSLDVFAIGADGTLLHWWWDGAWPWHGPESLGGRLPAGAPCAVSWGPNRLDVFAIGADATLQHWWWEEGGTWSRPESLGGRLPAGAGPAAVSWGPNRLDVFAGGSDATLQHWWWDGVFPWKGPENLGGRIPAISPVAVSHNAGSTGRAPDRLTVFCIGQDARLYRWRWDGRSWDRARPLGGRYPAGPLSVVPSLDGSLLLVVASDGRGQLDLWSVPDADGPFMPGPAPLPLDAGGGAAFPSAVLSTSGGAPRVDLFANAGSKLVHAAATASGWRPDPFLVAAAGSGAVNVRPLSPSEFYLAQLVFGDSVPLDRVWICDRSGLDGRAFTIPTNVNDAASVARAAIHALSGAVTGIPLLLLEFLASEPFRVGRSYTLFMGAAGYARGLSFTGTPAELARDLHFHSVMHELAHVWQGEHYATGSWEYVGNSLVAQGLHGPGAYDYNASALPPWSSFAAEQQAQIVEDWVMGVARGFAGVPPLPLSTSNPLYRPYIVNGILTKSSYVPTPL
ncbi:MAG TPA: hypothetical protein VF092_10095 [Longimicrobium sp.]